jgi:hypothetical protein
VKIVSLAAGVAVGYVLGSRAGREKYEQIAAAARRVSGELEARTAARQSGDTVVDAGLTPPVTAGSAVPRAPRRKPAKSAPGVTASPLV